MPKKRTSALDHLSTEIDRLFLRGEWLTAYEFLGKAEAQQEFDGNVLERFATAAYMVGREENFVGLMQRAYDSYSDSGAILKAAHAAFWIGLTLLFRGEFGQGTGWLKRSERHVDESGADCVERGYILLPRVESLVSAGDLAAADRIALEAVAVGARFGDKDLLAIARHLRGRIQLQAGRMSEGLALLDETMVAATTNRLSPVVTGLIYCSVIEICQNFQMYRRAKEWTDALAGWCHKQPELVAFTGRCLIHRSEVLIFDGKWKDALAEASAACRRLIDGPVQHHAAPAFYQEGEVHRLSGRFAEADECYRKSSQLGFDPQPGLALMRLMQGKTQSARSSIKRSLVAESDDFKRMRLLPAAIEIALGVNDEAAARDFCSEFARLAERFPSELAEATLAEADGDLQFAATNPESALPNYRRSAQQWRDIGSPYRLARVRLKTGRACAELGDMEGAIREAEAAIDCFVELGAEPDRRRAEWLLRRFRPVGVGLLTRRQTEVLSLVSEGLTNRAIADRLGLSERTIDRHVSDILTRINVPTRAAATAFALSRGLIAHRDPG